MDDPCGPQQLICIYCWPKRGDDGRLLRDEDGMPLRNCSRCVGRNSDRWCECTFCPWI